MPDQPIASPAATQSLPDRGVLRLSGEDRLSFLQGLVSNDVAQVAPGHAAYACLLTPQGKFLHDFLLIADGETLLIECEGARRDDLMKRLKLYKLRAKIAIDDETAGFESYALLPGSVSEAGLVFDDPRHKALGRRALLPRGTDAAALDSLRAEEWDLLRTGLAVPDGSRDMEVGKAILLENNIDLLNGIAWDKGCYMGQELTARTRYRGLIKKRLVPVTIAGEVPAIGTPLVQDGHEVGEMRSAIAAGDLGLALLRLEVIRTGAPIDLGPTRLTPAIPAYLAPVLAQATAS